MPNACGMTKMSEKIIAASRSNLRKGYKRNIYYYYRIKMDI